MWWLDSDEAVVTLEVCTAGGCMCAFLDGVRKGLQPCTWEAFSTCSLAHGKTPVLTAPPCADSTTVE